MVHTWCDKNHMKYRNNNNETNKLIFTGTGCIIMAAPTHYDFRRPIDVQYSKIDKKSDLMIMMKNAGMIDE